ncbi:nucleoporin NUP42-like isoform X1 [Gallus gallus]|uniref:nucleoporin NUP42-like isoform X1 n=1 Tax=Gallus gallus TaxID=9031 RepID=UPI001F0052FD|nr:nucleoporin NUP42-like isoform X1 [Gallus gallus]
MFQHTAAGGGGAGGGMGTTTQTNTNIIQPAVFQHTAGGGGGSGAPAAVTQPPVIANSTSGGSGDGGGLSGASGFGPAGNNGAVLSQNAFSALSSAQPADGQRDGQQSLLDVIAEDMATWESSGQWMFSCYSPETGKPNVPGFGEFSAEEVRLEYYNCSANNNTGYYINSVNQLVQQWRKRLQELKALNGSGKAAMQNGGGGGGGMGAATQRNTNLIRPAMFQHTAGGGAGAGGGGTGGGMGASSQTNTNLIQPAMFQHTAAGGGGAGGGMGTTTQRNKNLIRPAMFQHTAGGGGDVIAEDMATWESSGQWMFSCYSPETGKPNVPGFGEFSAEEVRLEYYNCSANNNTGYYINSVNQLVQQWRKRLQELKALNGSGKAAMVSVEESDVIAEDMATWESSGQWMFSCYSPETGKPNVPGFGEFSAEEVRLEYYNCSANNNTGYYINSVNQLVQQWRKRLQELKALNGSGKAAMVSVEESDVIAEDMATWESSGQWMFSCYSPETGKPNVPGFGEFSAEEVRLEYYNCSANNNTGYYINSVNQLVQQWRKRLQELKALNGSGKAAMAFL